MEDISQLKDKCPCIETGVIGKSAQGRSLAYVRLGSGQNKVFYNATHHSLEWITSLLLMKFAHDYVDAYIGRKTLCGYDICGISRLTSIYLLPMVNPDGVELVLHSGKKYANWQSNSRGVDLNHNYAADWEHCHTLEQAAGIIEPGPTRYGGERPFSEPETAAIARFCRKSSFNLALALHSQGEEIYWDFKGFEPPSAREFADELSNVSGYAVSTPVTLASCGGFKDWFIQEFRKYGFTIEVGSGTNPLPLTQFDKIYKDILEMLLICAI